MRFTLKTLTGLFAIALLVQTAGAASFTASLDRPAIMLGEQATLSLTFEGGQPENVTMAQVPNLQISQVGRTSQSSTDFSGHGTTVTTILLAVAPQKAGEFIIPAVNTEINGQKFSSPLLKLTVSPPSAPSETAVNSGNEIAFLKLSFPAKKVYVGEAVLARLDLYLRDEVQNFGNFQVTAAPTEGFSAGNAVELPNQRRRVQMGSRSYTIVPFTVPLTAIKSGAVKLGPFAANVVVVVPGGFFGEQRQLTLATETASIESLRLPAQNQPANFTGAVGEFTMTATAGPTSLTVGDPVTVRVQISGRGALDALTLPTQDTWHDFKTYPPTSKIEPTDQFGFQGTKTFEQIVSPLNADVHQLPPLTFAFFNPGDGQYHTLTHAAVPLIVHAAGATPLPALAANKTSENQSPPDILPIKQELGALTPNTKPLIAHPGFIAVQAVPLLAFVAAFVWRKRTDNLANNPRLRRQRAVAQLVAVGLNDLKNYAAANQSEEFFATLFRLLQEQLGERLDCPASAITEDVLEEHSILRDAPSATREGLHELFQLCNQARYAPVRGTSELNSVVAQFENVIGRLQELKA